MIRRILLIVILLFIAQNLMYAQTLFIKKRVASYTNLLTNGDFETGSTTPWGSWSSGSRTFTVTTSSPHGGTYCAEYYLITASSNDQISYEAFSLTNGSNYTIILWMKASRTVNGVALSIAKKYISIYKLRIR